MMEKAPNYGDERTVGIIRRLCTAFYLLTMTALWVDVMYRQFILGQTPDQFEDLAIILTANVLLWIFAALYSGGIPFGKFRLKSVGIFYLGFVALGTAFTAFKYGTTSFRGILDHLLMVAAISGVLVSIGIGLSYLGNWRVEKELSY